jgi:membrane protein DedA with SNARE-associated domain
MNATAEFVLRHGYVLLFFWILAEQAAVPIPSVPLLLVCGALVRSGRMNWMPILFLGLLACLIADGAWFEIGRRRGTKVLRFLCRVSLEPDSCVRQTENGFVRYGVKLLLISKFIPGMNALSAPLAGSAGADWMEFAVYQTAGSAIWIAAWGTVGYLFSTQLDEIGIVIGRAGFRLSLLIVVLAAAWIALKYTQRQRFIRSLRIARIPVEQLQRMLIAGEDVVVIDVRGALATPPDPIPGALRIPLSEIESRHKEIPRGRDIVLFCS